MTMEQTTPEKKQWTSLHPSLRAIIRSSEPDAPFSGAAQDISEAFGIAPERADELASKSLRSVFTKRPELIERAVNDLMAVSCRSDEIEEVAATIPEYLDDGNTITAFRQLEFLAKIVFNDIDCGQALLQAETPGLISA